MDWKPEAEAAVRAIMDAWAASVPDNPFQDFGKVVSLVSILEKPSFVVELRTLFDVRLKPAERVKMFDESLAASLAAKPMSAESVDVWSFESPLKKEYVTQQADIEVPGSFRAVACSVCDGTGTWVCQTCSGSKTVSCPDCGGQGKKRCERCLARGKIPCSLCRGKGVIPGIVKDNKPAPDTLCASCNGAGGSPCDVCAGSGGLPCAKCQSNGKLVCSNCQGRGAQPCPQCSAKGKILKGLSFRVNFIPSYDRSAVHDPELPEGLLPAQMPEGKVGERILESESESVTAPSMPSPEPYLKSAVDAALKKAEGAKAAQAGPARIVQQKLSVEKAPVFAVVYRHSGKIFDVWLAGLGGKAAAKESPFKDYAREQALKALALASQGRHLEAQGMLSKASAMAGEDMTLDQAQRVSAASASREFLGVHQLASVAAGLGLMAFLACFQGNTRHLFWPAFSFGVGALIAAFALGHAVAKAKAGWIPRSAAPRLAASVVLAGAVAALSAAGFSAARLPLRYDAREYQGLIADRFKGPPQPDNLTPEDQDFLKFMILTFEPLGVDVSDSKKTLEDSTRLAQEAKARAEAESAARLKKAEEAARARREIAQSQAKRQQQAKPKKKKKKPAKKKSKPWFGR